MASKNLIVLLFGVACVFQAANAACCLGGCNPCRQTGFAFGPGEDPCSAPPAQGAMVVRPQVLPKPPALPTIPLPGPCACTKAIVKPAFVPPPPPPTCTCQNTCGCGAAAPAPVAGCGCGAAVLNGVPVPVGDIPEDCVPIQYPTKRYGTPSQLAPADPVSLSIAYKLAQQNCIRGEDKLSFGFTKLPKEVPKVVKEKNNVPEENLYKLNGQIVELKKIPCGNKKSLEEEAAEELLALSDELVEPSEIRKVSLGEIGYAPAQVAAVPFVNVAVGNPSEVAAEAALAAKPCNDGFVPGNVSFKTMKKPQPLIVPAPELCDSSEEYEVPSAPAPAPPPPPPAFSFCQSTNKAASGKNIIFQQLGSSCL